MVPGIPDDPIAVPEVLADLCLGVTGTDEHFPTVAGSQVSSLIEKITPSMHEAEGSRPVLKRAGASTGRVPSATVSSHSCCYPHLGVEGSPLKGQHTPLSTSPGRKDGIQTRSR